MPLSLTRRKHALPAEVPAAFKPSAQQSVEEKKGHDVTSKVSAWYLKMEPAAGVEGMFGAFFNQTGTCALSSMVNMLVMFIDLANSS